MRNGAKGSVVDKWPDPIGRLILALAIISGGGVELANAVSNPPVLSGNSPNLDTTPTWTWTSGGGGIGTYRYKLDASIYTGGATITTSTGFTPVEPLPEGKHTLYVQEKDVAGKWSLGGAKSIVVDTTPPGPPTLTGLSPTRDTTPTWKWVAAGGGNGTFRYNLDLDDMTGATETTAKTYAPATPLSEGAHTLYVQERDRAGNWSISAGKELVVDITRPVKPVVNGVSPTTDPMPTWSWATGGGGSATFRHNLDNANMAAATVSTAVTYTPTTVLGEGTHILYVQERDSAGNWSASANKAIIILDATPPGQPIVSGGTPTEDTTPTWSWIGGGGGNGTFRYNLDLDDMTGAAVTSDITYTPETELGEGIHTLYVQERDSAGNWSDSGQMAIEVQVPFVMLSTIPDTGQTTSYTATFGEDHDYTINPPSYTVSVYGTVTDNATGLMWQQENDSTKRAWASAMTYCDNLNLANYSDWRLPTSRELTGILNLSRVNPPLSTVTFPCTYSANYWTATASASHTGFAWTVDFLNGFVSDYNKTGVYYARCVRGGE